jgi:protein gp37
MTPLYHHTFAPWRADGDRRIVADEAEWAKWIEIDRQAKASGQRQRVMVTCEVFEEWAGDLHLTNGDIAGIEVAGGGTMKAKMDDARGRLFKLIDQTPNLDWLICTEKPQNIERMMPTYYRTVPSRNVFIDPEECKRRGVEPGKVYESTTTTSGLGVYRQNLWLGTLIRTQADADERIPHLLCVPAAVRFAMCEPREGVRLMTDGGESGWDYLRGWKSADIAGPNYPEGANTPHLNLLVCRGETGPDARPMFPGNARSLRDQAVSASVPFYFSGWGSWAPYSDVLCGKLSDEEILGDGMAWTANDGRWSTAKTKSPDYPLDTALMTRFEGHTTLDGKTHDGLPEVAR